MWIQNWLFIARFYAHDPPVVFPAYIKIPKKINEELKKRRYIGPTDRLWGILDDQSFIYHIAPVFCLEKLTSNCSSSRYSQWASESDLHKRQSDNVDSRIWDWYLVSARNTSVSDWSGAMCRRFFASLFQVRNLKSLTLSLPPLVSSSRPILGQGWKSV